MPPKRSTKKNSNGQKSKSPQAISQLKHRANGSKLDYIVNARDVMSLKFVHSAADLDSLDGFFSPVYVHQLFTNEKIIGYKDLQIRVFFSQPSLHCYIEIEYNEKLKYDDTTDIIQVFSKWIQAGFTQNKQQFIKKLNEEFIPFGELQCQFIRPDHDYDAYNNSNNNNKKKNIGSDMHDITTRRRRNKRNTNQRKLIDYQSDNEDLSPRDVRLLRRKRRLNEINNNASDNDGDVDSDNSQPRKRRKLMVNATNNNGDSDSDSDAEDQKKDCIQSNDYDIFNNKNNQILDSKFNDFDDEIYEIRIGSFSDKRMREFHLRLQFFVLLYIESSSFLDIKDEIWEVMVIYKIRKGIIYATLGYLTLYKFYAYPDKKRLRISQVIIFPPYQRKGLGFEVLQHVYLMAKYRDFVEVNVEEPGPEFQKLRDTTDVYNAYKNKCFHKNDFKINNLTTYHSAEIYNKGIKYKDNIEDELLISYSANTKKNKKYLSQNIKNNSKPLFPFVSQHKKLSVDIYHSVIMNCHKICRITPEQARIAYECLKYENTYKLLGLNNSNINLKNGNDNDTLEWKLFKLDVKRRLYCRLNLENIHNYDENAIFQRLTQEFTNTIDRYEKIIKKRNDWLKNLNNWNKTHEYPQWIKKKLNSINNNQNNNNNNSLNNKKKNKNKKRRR